MINLEGQTISHLPSLKIRIENILQVMVSAAAETLAGQYRAELGRRVAPPHSSLGSVPHAYNGPRPGGFDNTEGVPGMKNNRTTTGNFFEPSTRFPRDQTDFLYTHIEAEGGKIGFTLDGHVTNRKLNYLLSHDKNGRPWVRRIYFRQRGPGSQIAKKMIAAAKRARRKFVSGGGLDVPF